MGTIAEKLTAILNSKAALRTKFAELLQDTECEIPDKIAEWPVLADRLVGCFACGVETTFEDDYAGIVTEYAFYGHALKYVNAPGVAWVYDMGFANCHELTEVHLQGVRDVSRTAFKGCDALATLELGPRCDALTSNMFTGLESLQSVTGLGGVESVEGDGARAKGTFAGCTALKQVDFSSALCNLGEFTFADCGALEDVGDVSGLVGIGAYCFEGCSSLTSGIERLPECAEIYAGAFSGCESLPFNGGVLKLPKLEMLESRAFEGCSLLNTLWLYGCTDIAEDALADSSVREIHFKGTYYVRNLIEADPGYPDRWGAGEGVTVKFDA